MNKRTVADTFDHDFGDNFVAPDDPDVLWMLYESGTKPGEDNGTPEEKAAYAAYYALRKAAEVKG